MPKPIEFVCVPKDPTLEMLAAAVFHTQKDADAEDDPQGYRAKGQAAAVWYEMIAVAPRAPAEAMVLHAQLLEDAKNTVLWLLRRLPQGYDEPPHVLRTIAAIDAAIKLSTPEGTAP